MFINLRYLRLKLLKIKENIIHHNFKNIPCYARSEVSLKRFYFALFDTLKLAYIGFCIKTSYGFKEINMCTASVKQHVPDKLNFPLFLVKMCYHSTFLITSVG